ncbi:MULTISPECIES: tetratricopeptide repeat protein [Mumia]|uniref:Tetratricopeptide repeat protein n=1 Tax=Mumia xiangluensis TaxID=1678900 RepID=A0ABW1QEQ2_9ACTN|nr:MULTISPECIES: hypothetical protein [Mumia]
MLLDALANGADPDAARRFQPAWALRAHLYAELGRRDEAGAAYEKAISLTTDTVSRGFLERARDRLGV